MDHSQRRVDVQRALTWLGLGLLALAVLGILWYGGRVLLLVFAGVLLAVVLRTPIGFLTRRTGMPDRLAYALVLLAILLLLTGFGMLVGPRLLDQASEFGERLPGMIEDGREWLEDRRWGNWLLSELGALGGGGGENQAGQGQAEGEQAGGEQAGGDQGGGQEQPAGEGQAGGGQAGQDQGGGQSGSGGGGGGGGVLGQMASSIGNVARAISTTLAHLALVVVLGLFLALNPRLYRLGIVRLFPASTQQRASEVVDELGTTLKYWLVGQLALMAITGVATGIGLAILGVPLALVLGFFVGLMEFIPFIGPIIGFIPILMISATEGMSTLLWALALYLFIQQLEGNVLVPLVQQRAVSLPPALTVAAVFLGGTLFGPLGAVLGTPLIAVLFVLVKLVYVHDILRQGVEVPGHEEPAPGG